jgi:hypothetical protein
MQHQSDEVDSLSATLKCHEQQLRESQNQIKTVSYIGWQVTGANFRAVGGVKDVKV